MTQRAQARSANQPFCKAELEFDRLIERLQELRSSHFNVDAEKDRDWGQVGSVNYVNAKLKEVLEHYGIFE